MHRKTNLHQAALLLAICGFIFVILQYFELIYSKQRRKLDEKLQTVSTIKIILSEESKTELTPKKKLQSFGLSKTAFNSLSTTTYFKMPFDLDIVNDSLRKCFDENLDLAYYNKAYIELYNFFSMLGTVFGFIASDVKEKIDILNKFREDENVHKDHYIKTEDMILHEIQLNEENGQPLLGSRTLLRLHRALKFTMLFLEELVKLNNRDKVGTMGQTVYGQSLANFHPWLIRNGAKIAMYSLPDKETFMKKIIPEGVEERVVVEKINRSVEVMHSVYQTMEDLYTKHDLHGLP